MVHSSLTRILCSSLLLLSLACANTTPTPGDPDIQTRGPMYECWADNEPIIYTHPDFHITLGCGGRINEMGGSPGADGYLWLRLEWF